MATSLAKGKHPCGINQPTKGKIMKTHFLFNYYALAISFTLWGISAYGQIQEKFEGETIYLEELKTIIKENNSNNDPHMLEVIKKLTATGSPNIVQFFLDNIDWTRFSVGIERTPKFIDFNTDFPMAVALRKMKDVPLRQCVDAFMESDERTTKAYVIERMAKDIHGDDFLQAIELRDAERGNDMRMRWYDNKKWQENERIRKGLPVRPPPPPPRSTNNVEIVIQDISPGNVKVTINGDTRLCSAEAAPRIIQRELEIMQANYEKFMAQQEQTPEHLNEASGLNIEQGTETPLEKSAFEIIHEKN